MRVCRLRHQKCRFSIVSVCARLSMPSTVRSFKDIEPAVKYILQASIRQAGIEAQSIELVAQRELSSALCRKLILKLNKLSCSFKWGVHVTILDSQSSDAIQTSVYSLNPLTDGECTESKTVGSLKLVLHVVGLRRGVDSRGVIL